jgi:hypothetical protein
MTTPARDLGAKMAILRDPKKLPKIPDLAIWTPDEKKENFKIKTDNAQQWFALDEVGRELVAALSATRLWLIKNDHQIGDDLKPDAKRSWYDNSRHAPTKDFALLDIRRSLLRQQLYAHGLLYLLILLTQAGVIHESLMMEPSATQTAKETDYGVAEHFFNAANLASAMVHLNMIGWDLIGRNVPFLNMKSLLPAYLYTDQKGDGRIVRENHAIPMIAMGLWSASRRGNEWRLYSGKVARLFHEHIYVPVARNYDIISESNSPAYRGIAKGFELPPIPSDAYNERPLPEPV